MRLRAAGLERQLVLIRLLARAQAVALRRLLLLAKFFICLFYFFSLFVVL